MRKKLEVAKDIGKMAQSWVNAQNGRFGGNLHVYVTPVGGGNAFRIEFKRPGISEETKQSIKSFVHNELKPAIQPLLKSGLGWSAFRIVSNARQKFAEEAVEMCYWHIEKR